jgi:autotransporter-associated beta strand protein
VIFRSWSTTRRHKTPLRGGLRTSVDRRQASGCFEWLEERQMLSSASWIGGATGYWDVAANWNNGAVPTSGTAVSIGTSGATVTIAPGETESAGSLAISAGAALSMPAVVNATDPTTNWLADSDFESLVVSNETTQPPQPPWWFWGTPGPYLNNQYAYTGSQSLAVSGAYSADAQLVSVTPGASCTTSVYAMTPNSPTGSATAYLNLLFYDYANSTYTLVDATSPINLTASNATGGPLAGSVGNQQWYHFNVAAIAPSGCNCVETQVETTTGTAVYFDDLELGPTPPGAHGPSTLAVGSISNSGTLTVGPTNTVAVGGTFIQASTGTLDVQLGGAPSTTNFGLVNISGAATLAGTLKADIVNGYSPGTTDTFTPIEYASESGSFARQALPVGSGYQFNSAVSFTNVTISAAPTATPIATVNASTSLHAVTTNLLGINTTYCDPEAVTTQTQQMASAAGLDIYRFAGGSAADDMHFNLATDNYYSGAITIPQFLQFIASANGTGVVTLDYGSGSPQEAAAELAYVDGSASDTTPIGNGIEWNDATGQWQTVPWQTVGYWASLRGQSPLPTDSDNLNFLRIAHPAPFTNIKYWEIGNEEYGSWEIDHHAVAHDPATYVKFAKTFASLASEIQSTAGLPQISIGIDSGDPTGANDGNWTKNVLADGFSTSDGLPSFVPGFISDHSYMQGAGYESDSGLLDNTVTQSGNVLDWTTRYADYQSDLQQTLGSQSSSVQVMATEYNSVAPGNVDQSPGKQSTSLVNGLFVAESLGGLMDSGYSGGFVWDLRNSWDTSSNNSSNLLYGWREGGDWGQLGDPNTNSPPTTGPYVAYPGYYALQLASKIIQSGGEVVSAASNYADLNVYAVTEASGDLELLVVNVNPDANLTEQFDLTGFHPSGAANFWQYGEAQDTAQSQSGTGASALASWSTNVSVSGGDFSYTFPAYSMTVIDLSPQKLTSISVQPISGLGASGTEAFAATALDQFGYPLAVQPQFTWSLVGAGGISSAGVYAPPYATGTATIEATSVAIVGSDAVALPGLAQWNGSANSSWNVASSWTGTVSGSTAGSPGLRGVSGDGVVFNAASGSVDLNGANPSIADVTFNSTGGYTIAQGSAGTLQLANGGGPATLSVTAGSATISAPVALDSDVVATVAAGSQLTISGGISGANQALAVNGQGTVVLGGTNSYSGGTTVSSGTLNVSSSQALPSTGVLVVGRSGRVVLGNSMGSSAAVPTVAAAPSDTVAPPQPAPVVAVPAAPMEAVRVAALRKVVVPSPPLLKPAAKSLSLLLPPKATCRLLRTAR